MKRLRAMESEMQCKVRKGGLQENPAVLQGDLETCVKRY